MISSNLLIPSIIVIALINLLVPFVSRSDSFARNLLMIFTSSFFFLNVSIIDWYFLNGLRAEFILYRFGWCDIAFNLESLGIIFLNLIATLWICAILYSTKFLAYNTMQDSSRFLFFMNLCVVLGVLIALSSNLFTMFIFYEILTLATIPLIAHVTSEKVSKGLYRYLKILMISSMLLFLPAIIMIYAKTGHANFIYGGIIENSFSRYHTIALLLMFIFGVSKTAIYPLHGWLPAAMVASYPVSALLHAVIVVKTGLFCVFKILMYIFGLEYLHNVFGEFNWIILLPVITIFYSSLKALCTSNIKMILAYSTITQLSLCLLSAFMFTPKAMAAAVMHMVAHSFAKISMFYAAGSFYSAKKTYVIHDLYDIWREMPRTSVVFVIAAFSLIGIPPLGGFISKFYIMLAAAKQEQYIVLVTVLISSVLTATYLSKIMLFIFRKHSTKREIYRQNLERNLPVPMHLSLYICTFVVVFYFIVQKLINQLLLHL